MKRFAFLTVHLLIGLAAASAASPKMPNFLARRDYAGLFGGFVQIADTNNDGIPDLIDINGGYVQVLLGTGKGGFSAGPGTHTVISDAGAFVATDLTGSGNVDLVQFGEITVGGDQSGIAISLGNGDGTFQKGTFYPAGTNPDEDIFSGVLGDFNNDGIPDVVAAGASGVWLFTGEGNGLFNPGVLAVPFKNADGAVAAPISMVTETWIWS